ncbi:MAG: acetylornithine transaminase [Armatimonadetes bacterium]|nr:acetylornithine transaminase [Armatimonadota bacterium]
MDTQTVAELSGKFLMSTYKRAPVAFASGQGVRLTDMEGKTYLDFVAGIAVSILGHNHPELVSAIAQQASKVIHTSNLYLISEQAKLGQWLVEHSACDRAFFCNSGAEANETAIKLARKYGAQGGRFEIIVADRSFHGRTLAALAATAQPKYHKGFEPLPPGFVTASWDDLAALESAITPSTCAIMLEPIQGEGGLRFPSPGYLEGVRRLCDQRGLVLILDEIQTGMGRTGRLFAYEQFGIEPDVVTLAKGLGGGVPIGAVLAKARIAEAFQPGDHGSTFGGNFLASAAALAVVTTIERERLPEHAARIGAYLIDRLRSLSRSHPVVTEVRGLGLMVAVELSIDAAQVVDACRERGLLVNAVQPTTLRLVPPLIITRGDVDEAVRILDAALAAVAQPATTAVVGHGS